MSVLLTEKVDGALILTLNVPEQRNILTLELASAISDAVAAAHADPDIRMLIVTGTNPSFCAGAQLSDLQDAAAGKMEAVQAVYRAFTDIADSPLPTLAAVNGPAVGAGFNLALACDMRIASDNAWFDTRFLTIGLHPGGGHGWMLLRAVGWAQTSRLLFCDRVVRAAEAKEIGLVLDVVAPEALRDAAVAKARALSGVSRELLLRTKASLRAAAASDHATALAHETAEQAWSLQQPAFTELANRLQRDISSRKDKT